MSMPIVVEKYGIRLRPVTFNDARFIYDLRTDPDNSKYIGEFSSDYSVHLNWLNSYLEKDNTNKDYYFVAELLNNKPVGTIGIYNIENKSGNWGRFIVKPGIPVAAICAWLIYHVAFDHLCLDSVYSNTIVDNKNVVSFHESCGLEFTRIDKEAMTIKGHTYDVIIHTAHRENWPKMKQKMEHSIKFAERLLSRL
jgi:RimJ/RimL family protein N-acetyltransferase